MRTSDELVEGLHDHMKAWRRLKARRRYRAIGSAAVTSCLAATMLVAVLVSQNPVGGSNAIVGSVSGSIFAGNAVLGYVVVALVAFCLGALVTVFCTRLKERAEEEEQDNARPDR